MPGKLVSPLKLCVALAAFFTLHSSLLISEANAQGKYTHLVNPLLGTATLHDPADLGYVPQWRTWGAEVFPGSSLPFAMVQVSPVTMFGSGAGYQYEDEVIYAFSHTNKGHWNLNHVPMIAYAGDIGPDDYASPFSHERESAAPGYYSVFLERGGIEAEVTSTLRAAVHRYRGRDMGLLLDLQRANDRVRRWSISQQGSNSFSGWQQGGETVFFWAETSAPIESISHLRGKGARRLTIVDFSRKSDVLEVRIGFSFTSVENARENLRAEVGQKSFDEVRVRADDEWNAMLGKIRVEGGTDRQRGLFYTTLYRSMLWPALRSDVGSDSRVYTNPSFWDDYRNKLVLMALMAPDVAADVINSITLRGEQSGFMPTFFHGDHASVFVAGTYLRGIREGYDIERAYKLLMNNATVEGKPARRGGQDSYGGRPYLSEYIERGWISEEVMDPPFVTADERKSAVTKTQEYAYDDYATALLARELGHTDDYELLIARKDNWKNLFNPANGFMQGRFEDGSWVEPFDPYFPYYAYMYREANGWQSIFYAPHDPQGMVDMYPSPAAAEAKLDSLFTEPWRGIQAHNMSGFIGQYCHGNQPDHGFPYMYYWLGKQPKSQAIIDRIMETFYDMGPHRLAYCGMDDAGEMSAWYVMNALGIYTFSPADPEYIVSVPLFDRAEMDLGSGETFTIRRKGSGHTIRSITVGGRKLNGFVLPHTALTTGKEVVVRVN